MADAVESTIRARAQCSCGLRFRFRPPRRADRAEPRRPAGNRACSCWIAAAADLSHCSIADLPGLLRPGDLLVVNNTRVFAARLLGHRVPSGGAVECLLLSQRAAR